MSTLDRLAAALADRYRVDRELGAGGMATVYLARDERHAREVAIKVLHPELAAVLGAERFLSEIRTTASLQHPHILPLFDSGEAAGQLFYVMPFVDGETLRTRLEREKQLPIADALLIAREVADALQYAHERGIIHRDIKPENILLQGGHALVADFGIALAVTNAGGTRMTQTGLSLGTPQYMAPEQAMGERSVDARADVYALGAVTYEMLAGEPPFTGPTSQAIVAKIMSTDAPRLDTLRRNVPAHVADAVHDALEKLPADRPATAARFASTLAGETRAARSQSRSTATRTTDARAAGARRRIRLLVGALPVIAAAAGAVGWWFARRTPVERPVVRLAISTALGQPMGTRAGKTLAISRDGQRIAWASIDSAGRPRLFVRDLSAFETQVLEMPGTANSPFFSPNGEWIGYDDARSLFIVPSRGGAPTRLASGDVFGAAWGPQGIVVSLGRRLSLVQTTGAVTRLELDSTARAFWPAVLPHDGAIVFSRVVSTDSLLQLLPPGDGAPVSLGVRGAFPLAVAAGELVYAMSDGTLMAVPFDERAHTVTGVPHPVIGRANVSGGVADVRAVLSTNGVLAYVSGLTDRELIEVDRSGAERRVPLPTVGAWGSPRYAPDGRRVALDVRQHDTSDVWVLDLLSQTARRLTTEGTSNVRPNWNASGTAVLFASDRRYVRTDGREFRQRDLWQQSVNASGGAQRVLTVAGTSVFEADETSDGRTLVVRAGQTPAALWIGARSGDTVPRRLTTSRFGEMLPDLSPDDRWIAYVTDESGTRQVVVRPFRREGVATPISLGEARSPVWTRDGRTLVYAEGSRIIRATLGFADGVSVIARETWIDRPYVLQDNPRIDVSPDGQRLLLLRAVSDREEIRVILNWDRELTAQRRAGASIGTARSAEGDPP